MEPKFHIPLQCRHRIVKPFCADLGLSQIEKELGEVRSEFNRPLEFRHRHGKVLRFHGCAGVARSLHGHHHGGVGCGRPRHRERECS